MISTPRYAHFVNCFRGSSIDGRAVDGVHERTQERVAGEHKSRQCNGLKGQIGSRARADNRRAPQRCRRSEAPYTASLLHDHAGAEETHAV